MSITDDVKLDHLVKLVSAGFLNSFSTVKITTLLPFVISKYLGRGRFFEAMQIS